MIVEAFPLREADRRRAASAGAVSSGAACALLLFLKANYFLVGCGAGGGFADLDRALRTPPRWRAGSGLRRRSRWSSPPTCASICSGYVRRFAHGGRRAQREDQASLCGAGLRRKFPRLPDSGGAGAMAGMSRPPAVADLLGGTGLRYRAVLLAGMLFVGSVALLVSNCQFARLPIHELLALLFLDCILQSTAPTGVTEAAVLAMVGAGLILGTQSSDPLALVNGLRLKLAAAREFRVPHDQRRVRRIGVHGRLPGDARYRTPLRPIPGQLSDRTGRNCCAANAGPAKKSPPWTITIPSPSPSEPAAAGGAWHAPCTGICSATACHPTAGRLFGNADVMMFPKEHGWKTPDGKAAEVLHSGNGSGAIRLVAESALWKLYRRKTQ